MRRTEPALRFRLTSGRASTTQPVTPDEVDDRNRGLVGAHGRRCCREGGGPVDVREALPTEVIQ